MQSDFVDETGSQIPVEFEEKGLFTRVVHRISSKLS